MWVMRVRCMIWRHTTRDSLGDRPHTTREPQEVRWLRCLQRLQRFRAFLTDSPDVMKCHVKMTTRDKASTLSLRDSFRQNYHHARASVETTSID